MCDKVLQFQILKQVFYKGMPYKILWLKPILRFMVDATSNFKTRNVFSTPLFYFPFVFNNKQLICLNILINLLI